ncbi:MAG TPA: cytochrome P450 [Solirubrobacterales bacterium]|nr:cytochrome P450 [Solirubrobacterales bacterium]
MSTDRTIAELPGPRGLPLVGSAHKLVPMSRSHLVFEQWARRYGPIFRVKVGPRMVVAIDDEEAINAILRDRPAGFRRWRNIPEVIQEINEAAPQMRGTPPALFAAEGEEWKRQRRLVVTALNKDHLHRYFGVVRTATKRLHRRLLAEARASEAVAISEALTAYTVDVTSALAFGHDLNTLEHGDGELQRHIQRMLVASGHRITAAVPYWRWLKLPSDRALDRSMVEVYRATEGFIGRAQARMEARPELFEQPENLIEGLLAAQRADPSFSDQEIAGNLITVLLAGEDTTAHTLGWTIWLLGSRPDVQEHLRDEAATAFGRDPIPAEYAMAEQLPYAEAVLRESMRLKSVAPTAGVEPNEDRTICDTHIPAGTQLLLLMRRATRAAAGRSEDFYPERWLEDSEETRAPKSLSFGAGPRFCPGRNLAFLEAKAALGTLARNFEIELDESGQPVRESFGFTMVPDGLRVRLRERRDRSQATAGLAAT